MKEFRNILLGLALFAAACLRFHCHVSENNTELSKIPSAKDTKLSEIPSVADTEPSKILSANRSELAHIPSPSDFELVYIYFTDGKTEIIPLLLFPEIFSLPSNYLCSSTEVTDVDNNSNSLNTFMID